MPEGAQRTLLECAPGNPEKACAPQQGTLSEGAQCMLLERAPQQGILPEGAQCMLHESVLGSANEMCTPRQCNQLEGAHHTSGASENVNKQDFDELNKTDVSGAERGGNVVGHYILILKIRTIPRSHQALTKFQFIKVIANNETQIINEMTNR